MSRSQGILSNQSKCKCKVGKSCNNLYVGEKFGQGGYSFVGPLKLCHLLDEHHLGNGHLSEGEVGIRHDILGGPEHGDLSEGYDIIYFGEPESVVILSVLMLSSICATFLCQVPELEVLKVLEVAQGILQGTWQCNY
jgi:hypothetical protein